VGQAAVFNRRVDRSDEGSDSFDAVDAGLVEAIRRNERLASVGLLAVGIAHEINNPLGSALLAAETALAFNGSPDSSEHVTACLQNIVTSLDRCGRIVRTLLRYSREEPVEKQACSINDVVEQALDLARPYLNPARAELRLDFETRRFLPSTDPRVTECWQHYLPCTLWTTIFKSANR
jgi:C4-dicarboxylate-specific signal transduction histidine kinase